MSTPASTRPPAPMQPTRQQIDDLDALLQRMLSLPVKVPEEDLDEVEERALEEAAVAAVEPAEMPINYPLPEPEARADAEPVRTTAPELVSQGHSAPMPEVKTETEPASRPAQPAVRLTSVIQRPALDSRVRRGVLLQALVRSNRVFDRWTGRLGAPGQWLRRPGGRSLLGWTGLFCLLAALLLLLKDWVR